MFSKTYRYLFVAGFLFFMVACTKDQSSGEPPHLQFIQDSYTISTDTSIAPGKLMHFSIKATAGDEPITQFLIRVITDSSRIYYDTGMYVNSFEWNGSFAKSFAEQEKWEFTVRDRFSLSQTISIVIKNDSLSGFGPVATIPDVELGGQENSEQGGFYSLLDQLGYFIEEAYQIQDEIEMIYYFFGEDENTIASPGANIEEEVFPAEYHPDNWTYRNTTRYIKSDITEEQFNTIENDSILIVSYVEGEGKRKAKNLQHGDIYSFKTQNARFGMFLVKQVNGTVEGSVDIEIKIQQ